MTAILPLLGIKVAVQLAHAVVWSDGSAAAVSNVDGNVFHMRKIKDSYALSLVEGVSERELTRIDAKDTQLTNRLLAAVGDACQAA